VVNEPDEHFAAVLKIKPQHPVEHCAADVQSDPVAQFVPPAQVEVVTD